MSVPYTDSEASEARQWSNRYGPPNAWTASLGTAARMIGRLLNERDRLRLTDAEREAVLAMACYCDTRSGLEWVRLSATLRGLLERMG